jgi:hypothetical protein
VTPWKIPLVVTAIAVPIAAGFALVGPAVGLPVGALVAMAIVAIAVGQRPRGAIGPDGAAGVHRALVVVAEPLEDPTAVEEVAAALRGGNGGAEVMILAPARIGFLDRWASDVEAARRDAQRRLVISVASLAAAGVEAEARVGDEDVVQAVEDQLGTYPANEVILVSASSEDHAISAAASELRSRLRGKFRWVLIGPAAR